MQYALSIWSRSTYKTAILSWNMERVISQTRAFVEMADATLARVEDGTISKDEVLEYKRYTIRNNIIECLQGRLNPIQMPDDLRRLAITVEKDLHITFTDFDTANRRIQNLSAILGDPNNKDIVNADSLTAYNTVFIALFRGGHITKKRSDGKLELVNTERKTILVTGEMLSFCPDLKNLAPEFKVDLTFGQ